MTRNIALLMLAAAAPAAAAVYGDAARGSAVFENQKCVTCHSVSGKGARTAPDLGKRSGRQFTPESLAATMWNHAPEMWSVMDASNIARPKLSAEESADLFAYFYAARYFDARGDAARGRRLFVNKGCSECHNITSSSAGGGTAVTKWETVVDPVELSRQMWNHAPQMKAAAEKKNMKTPQLTVAEMTDILVYLQSLPQTRNLPVTFSPASPETGETLFKIKGCEGCHRGSRALPKAGGLQSTAEIAAAMWNHAGSMRQSSPLRPEEMSRILGYIFSRQFEKGTGDAARGGRVLAAKGCTGCHSPSPKASTPYEIVSALWTHGPGMLKQMRAKNVSWPRFSETEMADLLAALRK